MPPLIEPGKLAPDFTLRDQRGKAHSLSDSKGKTVVLYFYPEDDTPVCTVQACDMNDSFDRLTSMGVVVLAISPQDITSKAAFAEKFGLRFALLADELDKKGMPKVCTAYGIYGEKLMYGKTVIGIKRCTYVIGPDGRVRHRFDNVRSKGHAGRIIRWLEANSA